jgi:hypothetical protein
LILEVFGTSLGPVLLGGGANPDGAVGFTNFGVLVAPELMRPLPAIADGKLDPVRSGSAG